MADVFVSYAREDQDRVVLIVKAIERVGLTVWWDRDIGGGSDFVVDTEKELNDAAACVVCWSKESVLSRWVRDEASAAAEQDKLIPVQFDIDRAPMGFRQYQLIDFTRWSGDDAAPCFEKLIEAIRTRTNTRPGDASATDASIAVLPFVNLSGDATCQNFCDAVGADIISLLAKNKDLRVLARGLSFARLDPAESVAEAGRRLNVRYIVDGTIRRAASSARITADLVLSSTGQLLWSGQTEGRLDDVFALQDEMAGYLAGVVAPELGRFERELAARKNPGSLTAWECAQRGAWHLYRLSTAGGQEAESWFRKAIAIDAGFSHGHAGLSHAELQLALYGPRAERRGKMNDALQSSARAVAIAPDDAYCRFVRARALCFSGDGEAAIGEAKAALDLNPSYAHAHFALGCAYAWNSDSLPESISCFDRALQLSPQDPIIGLTHLMKGLASFVSGDIQAAEASTRAAVRQHNATLLSFAALAAILGVKGDKIEANAVAKRLKEIEPSYDCTIFAEDCFFMRDKEALSRLCGGLRVALAV